MSWIAVILLVIGAAWFLRSWWRWNRKQAGDANELDWLDEIVREHTAGKQDHSKLIRRAITDIERDHEPSPALSRELRRAKDAIGYKD
ncbi:hypothetical protein [Bradyrhizobium sp. USDA 4473]